MLFLVAGRTDYCLLVLDAGRLKVGTCCFFKVQYFKCLATNVKLLI